MKRNGAPSPGANQDARGAAPPKVGILILNFNGAKWLPGLIGSIYREVGQSASVYLVDNASTDGSVELVRQTYRDVCLILNDNNLGYAAAYNLAIVRAIRDGCEWLCLQNTDTLVTKGWLEVAMSAAAKDPGIGVLGPVFVEWEGDEPNYYMRGRNSDVIPYMFDSGRDPIDRDWVEGSSFFISRACFESVGPLNDQYFMYWEEADFCRRAQNFGWRTVIAPGSVCRHFGAGSTSSPKLRQMKIRNHLLFKMTDPSSSTLQNIGSGLRLAMTYFSSVLSGRNPGGNWEVIVGILSAIPAMPEAAKRCSEFRGRKQSP